MKFEYSYFEGSFLPVVPLKMKKDVEWIEAWAFVDSGASFSIFHAEIAEILGLELEEGEQRNMKIGNGDSILVYLHSLVVSFAGEVFSAQIGFSNDIGTGVNILGRKTFFDFFVVSFHEKKKYIEFLPEE